MNAGTEPIIEAEGLTRIFTMGQNQVLGIQGVDLIVASEELIVLKGRSGSGKSTLLSLLAGLDRPSSGRLRVAGHELSAPGKPDLTRFRREKIGMVFQAFNLLPTLNVLENICLPALLAGTPYHQASLKAQALAGQFDLSRRANHRPAQLSGGEMQRTAIARALVNDPPLILADEPTGNLDSRNGQAVMEILDQLNRKWGRTVIIATHSTIADHLATRVIRLEDGRLA
jgi:ABC-type lipoprotein export system ATPase subunit